MKLKKLFAISAIAGVALLASCNNGGATTTETKVPETTTKAPDPTTTVATKVLSYDEYLAAEVGSEVTIEAYITGRTTWYNNAASFYLADDHGGYYVYNLPCTEEEYNDLLVKGAFLEVTGAKAEWKGEVEINGQTATENAGHIVLGASKTYEAILVNDIAKSTLDLYKNQLVKTKALTVTKAPYTNFDDFTLAPAAGVDVYFEVSDDNGNTATYVVEAYLEDSLFDSDTYKNVCNLHVGDTVVLEGFIYYWENPQMQITKCDTVA